jgi:hypothetical protein
MSRAAVEFGKNEFPAGMRRDDILRIKFLSCKIVAGAGGSAGRNSC